MKKIISVFLAAVTVFALFSCNNTTGTDTETAEGTDVVASGKCNYGIILGDYVFAAGNNKLMKYNIHDGTATYLCPDPFCQHGGRCQFANAGENNFASIGNVVYYIDEDTESGKSTVFAFDADTNETKAVYSVTGRLLYMFAYYYKLIIRYIDSSRKDAEFYYFWYDTKTGKTEKLTEGAIPRTAKVRMIYDDKIVWFDISKHRSYCSDLQGGDYKLYDDGYRYGNYYSFEDWTDDDGEYHIAYYVTLNGEDEKKLLKEDIYPLFAENKIVYVRFLPKDERRYVYQEGYEMPALVDLYGGDVYVMDPDGSNDHLLFHTDEFIGELNSFNNRVLVSGDIIGILSDCIDEEDGDCFKNLIIANVNTGEFVISHE